MKQSSSSQATNRPSGIFTREMAKVAWQVAGVTLLIVFLAFFGGVLLDRYLNTSHILTIVLVICAGPLAMYASYRLAMRAVKAAGPAGQPGKPDGRIEEEKAGE